MYNTFYISCITPLARVGEEDAVYVFKWHSPVSTIYTVASFSTDAWEQMVHLPVPKTHYAKDIVFKKDVPIFCTIKQQLFLLRTVWLAKERLIITIAKTVFKQIDWVQCVISPRSTVYGDNCEDN